jgi:hypothetical protein
MAGPKRFSIAIDDNEDFDFEYDPDTQGPLTQSKVAKLYEAQRPRSRMENLWSKITTSALPERKSADTALPGLKTLSRFGDWTYEKVARPSLSALGAATLPFTAFKAGRLGLAALGTGIGAYNAPEAVTSFVSDPTLEKGLDVGLDIGMIVGGPLAARSALKPTPKLGIPTQYKEPIGPKRQLALPTSRTPIAAAIEEGNLNNVTLDSITRNPDFHFFGNQFPTPPLELPAAGTGAANRIPKFFQGRAGVADIDVNNLANLDNPTYWEGRAGTVMPHEYGSVLSSVSDPTLTMLAAERGMGAIGGQPLTMPRTSAGMQSGIMSGSPGARAFEALVPERYKVEPFEAPGIPTTKPVYSGEGRALPTSREPGLKVGRNVIPPESYVNRLGRLGKDVPFDVVAPPVEEPFSPVGMRERTRQVYPGEIVGDKVKGKGKIPNNPVVQQGATSPVPDIQAATQEMVASGSRGSRIGRIAETFRQAWEDPKRFGQDVLWKAGSSVIKSDSEAGKKIMTLVDRARTDGDMYGGQWSLDFRKNVIDGLGKDEWNLLREAKEGNISPAALPAELGSRLNAWNDIDASVVAKAKETGTLMKTVGGEVVPFEGIEHYFPRMYSDEFLAAMKKNPKSVYEQLLKEGHSPEQANDIIASAKKFGGRFISPQNQRQANIPGYRTDPEAYLKHLSDMGKRIGESEHLGPNDLADKKSPLSQLVNQTSDPQRVTEILERHLNRDVGDSGEGARAGFVNKVNTFNAATDLSMFAIGNQANKSMIPLRADMKSFLKGLQEYKTAAGKESAEASGALQSALRDVIDDVGGEGIVSKVYRTGASEKANRGLAAVTGKHYADGLFEKLKSGKISKNELSRLEDLTLESADTLRSMDSLGDKLTNRAGARMSELTQGLAGSIDLPQMWSADPSVKLLTMYKKYAFRQSKAIKDFILENPSRNIPLALGMMQLFGEGIGDVKEAIKAPFSDENPLTAIAERGKGGAISKLTGEDHQYIDRFASNLSQSWALGLIGQFIESGNFYGGPVKFMMGPTASKISDLVTTAVSSPKNFPAQVVETITPPPFRKPLGSALREAVKEDRSSPRLLPSIPGPRLPRLPGPRF